MAVKEAAKLLGIGRPALSNLLNRNADRSPEMAARLEKAFGADQKELLKMQAHREEPLYCRDVLRGIIITIYDALH